MSAFIRLLRRRGSVRTLALITLLVLTGGTLLTLASLRPTSAEPIDRAAYDQLMSTRMRSLDDLLNWFYAQQDQLEPIIPPGLDLLRQPGWPDVVVWDTASRDWPEALQKALSALKPTWRNSVPTYELELQEHLNGELTISDTGGNVLYTVPTPNDYQVPYEALYRQSLNPLLHEPLLNRYKLLSRIVLLPQDQVEPYLYVQAELDAYAQQQADSELPMMLMIGSCEDMTIADMQNVSNQVQLTLCYPVAYSGQTWSVYGWDLSYTGSFTGLEGPWSLVFDNLVLTGETATSWTDLQPMGSDTNGSPAHRFYGVGSNEDPDHDGLQSGYELFVIHSDDQDADSDGDGLGDGWEVAHGLDPNDGTGVHGALGDLDADGLSNAEEQEAGTDPRVANPVHEVGPEEAVFEYRSAEVVRSKPGFVNFAQATTGVDRCYLVYESYGEVAVPHAWGASATWSSHRSVDPVTGKTPRPGDTGSYESEGVTNSWYHSTLNMTFQSTGTWWLASEYEDGQGILPESFAWVGSCTSDDPLDAAEADFIDAFYYYLDTYWRPEFAVTVLPTYRVGYDGGYSREDFLSDEYTTAMLTNRAWTTLGAAPALTNLVWGTGWVHRSTRTFGWEVLTQATYYASAQTAASYRVTANEAECEVGRSGYRLRIPTQSGVVSRVHLVEWFSAGGTNSPVVMTSRVAVVLGSGSTQSIERSRFTFEPPTQPGVVFVGLLRVELLSDKAANSPKSFECGKTNPGAPCGNEPEQAESLNVYFSDAFNYSSHQIEDFDVTLRVSPTDLSGVTWSKASGPSSGSLVNPNQAEAIYRNPKLGGLYQLDATVQSLATRTQLLLPLGGPDVTDYFLSECERYDNWLSTMKARVTSSISDDFARGFAVMSYFTKTVAHMNHKYETFEAGSSPCEGFCDNTVTISEYVFGKDHVGNFLFSYLAARTGFNFGTTQFGAKLVALLTTKVPDNPDDQAAYTAGFAFGQSPSSDFKDILESKDIYAMQNELARRGWPSTDTDSGSTYPTWGATHGGLDNPD